MNQPIQLLENYYAKVVDDTTIFNILNKYRTTVFPNTVDFKILAAYSDEEKKLLKKKKQLARQPTRLSYVVEQAGKLSGWCTAYEKDIDEWYMHITAIFKEHRKKGLYTAVLKLMLAYAKKEGYQKVTSVHNATNNAIIIPKLKAGFVISGMHINEKFGTMVELTYYINLKIKAVVEFRSGQKRLPQNLKEHLNIYEDKIS